MGESEFSIFHWLLVMVVLILYFLPGITAQIVNKKHQMAITWLCLLPVVGWIAAWVWFFLDKTQLQSPISFVGWVGAFMKKGRAA